MTIETAFLDLMPSTITIYPMASSDAYGKRTFSATGTTVRCRIQERDQRYTTERNEDYQAVGTIICYGTPSIDLDSKVVLPDGTQIMILSIVHHNDESGAHHTSISFGK